MLPDEVLSYDFAFTQASIGMALISFDGTLVEWTSALCDLLGYGQNELHSLSQSSCTIMEQFLEMIQFGKRLHSMDIDQHRFEQYYDHPSGHRLSLDISIAVILDTQGEPLYYFAQFENKTMLKQLETQLQVAEFNLHEKEDSFQQLLEGLPLSEEADYQST